MIMNFAISLIIIGIGGAIGALADIYFHAKEPLAFWSLGTMTGILAGLML